MYRPTDGQIDLYKSNMSKRKKFIPYILKYILGCVCVCDVYIVGSNREGNIFKGMDPRRDLYF